MLCEQKRSGGRKQVAEHRASGSRAARVRAAPQRVRSEAAAGATHAAGGAPAQKQKAILALKGTPGPSACSRRKSAASPSSGALPQEGVGAAGGKAPGGDRQRELPTAPRAEGWGGDWSGSTRKRRRQTCRGEPVTPVRAGVIEGATCLPLPRDSSGRSAVLGTIVLPFG